MSIRKNLEIVRERIAKAAKSAGRSPGSVALVTVSKTVDVPTVREAHALGLRLFGENRPQELQRKAEVLGDLPDIEWHMIGHLQRNKVKAVVPLAALIHSVDSLRLMTEISKYCVKNGCSARILLEVNVSEEESKFGFRPEQAIQACQASVDMEGFRIQGLMTMAPFTAAQEETRPVFVGLRELAETIESHNFENVSMRHLSMGMSNDFEVAVQEGATLVRIGTALWEG